MGFNKFVNVFLSLLFISPIYAEDVTDLSRVFLNAEVQLDPENFLPDYEAVRVSQEVFKLFRGVNHLGRQIEADLDHDHKAFMDFVRKKEVVFRLPGVGLAELNSVDGVKFVRVRHQSSKMAFIFLNKSKINPNSSHLRQIEARQHISARRYKNGNAVGRNIVYIWYNGEKDFPIRSVDSVEYSPKHKKYSSEWWKDYWVSIYKKPSRGDVYLAVLSTVMQVSLASGLSGLRLVLGVDEVINWGPALLSIPFAFGITLYISTYLNWKHLSSNFRNALKSSLISLIFAGSLMAIVGDGFSSLSPVVISKAGVAVSWDGLILDLLLISNMVGNNLAKVEWERKAQIRREMRLSEGEVNLVFNAPIKRSSLENQMIYLIPYSLRTADVLFPFAGKVLLWASIPIAKLRNLRYAVRVDYEHAGIIKNEWQAMRRLYVPQTLQKIRHIKDRCLLAMASLLKK